MKSFVKIDNLQNKGIVTKVINELNELAHISDIKVNLEEGKISFICTDELGRYYAIKTLRQLAQG